MKNILVIDDESEVLSSIKRYLEFNNHHVDATSDFNVFMDDLLERYYDLMLIDVLMPTIRGDVIIEFLQQLEIKTPIAIISALPDNMINLVDLKNYKQFKKPIDLEELECYVKNL